MMRLWVKTHAGKIVMGSAAVSLVLHTGIITAWVIGTMPAAGLERNAIANRIFYIPPPDRVPTQGGSRESVHYVRMDAPGVGTGEGPRMMGEARPVTTDETVGKDVTTGKDSIVAKEEPTTVGPDEVYSVLEVDTAVVRSSASAAPVYPLKLLQAHIQGYVNAQYVVDTSGRADTSSFEVLKATNPEFVTAVKDVLPHMRFESAKIGSMKVRQLVQQQFSFKINDGLPPATPPKKP